MNRNRIRCLSYVIVFLVLVIGLGFLSAGKLVSFYVDQEIDYNEWTPEMGSEFETDIASTFYNKFGFVNLNGAFSSVLQQPSMNGVYKLKNGHLIYPQEKLTNEEIENFANEVIKYADYCKSRGKAFLFVQPILKVDPDNKQLPSGVEDYSNENIDYYLDCLKRAGVDVLDIRQCMKQDGIDLYDNTYVTDHHWTTEGCFYSFVKITEWIEENLGLAVDSDVTNLSQYDIIKYPKWHLGSYGQRVGEYYAGIDDYDLIIPKFDVSFIDDAGNSFSFNEQAVNSEVFENRDVTSRYTYDHALSYPKGIATTSQKLRVLFITDSYATAMIPYLKLAYSDYLSQYYPEGFDSESINQLNPDVVIMMPFITNTFNSGAVFK